MDCPHLRNGELCPHFFRVESSTEFIWNSSARGICLFFPTCLFVQSSINKVSVVSLTYLHQGGCGGGGLNTPLLSGTTRRSRLVLCIPAPVLQPAISPRPLVLFIGERIQKTRYAGCYQGTTASMSSHLTQQGRMCVCTNPYILIYVRMFLKATIRVCIKTNMSSY